MPRVQMVTIDGEALKGAMRRARLTATETASAARLTEQMIYKAARGRPIGAESALAIAEAIGVELESILIAEPDSDAVGGAAMKAVG